MLIKSADDLTKRRQLLKELQHSARLDGSQRSWLKDELERLDRGARGERDAAHYIDAYFKDSKNHVVLHDLRLVVDGQVAQIDHLVMARGFLFYLFETKNFNGNLQINALGEFSVRYGSGRSIGIPSPIEQSRRHEPILVKLLEQLDITGRVGRKPLFEHVVLIDPKATISRPEKGTFDTGNVIKADQIGTWHERYVDKDIGVASTIGLLLNLRSLDTLVEWGNMLTRQHRPRDPLQLPAFLQPKPDASGTTPTRAEPAPAPTPLTESHAAEQSPDTERKRLICATCGCKITFQEGRFCWSRADRFGGRQYCRVHQANFP